MSVTIKYKGNTIASANTNTTKTIKTSGKYCEADIEVINTHDGGGAPVINPLSVTENGTYNAPSGVDGYSPVTVNVPQGITPTGEINITENGTYDVTEYASANVNVPQGITPSGNINITDTNVTDVTSYATAQVVSENLKPENIKKNIDILGIIGSFEGGGGSLPTSITKIDGGSFTLASDTGTKNYNIAHSLGVIPKGAMVWTEDNSESVAYTTFNFVQGLISSIPMTSGTTEYYGAYQMQARRADGTVINYQGNMTAAQFSMSERNIWFPNNNPVYKAGCTYKWLAWA